MATNSVSPIDVVSAVEEYLDSLPAKRRGRRTRAEIDAPCDITPEFENYAPAVEPPIIIELDDAAQVRLPVLLHQLGQARSTALAAVIITKIYDLLGLELEGGA